MTSRCHSPGIICANSPLNGTEAVYSRGFDTCFIPVADWWSPGYSVGCAVHFIEYTGMACLKDKLGAKLGPLSMLISFLEVVFNHFPPLQISCRSVEASMASSWIPPEAIYDLPWLL
jgi:hypothetical protein